MNLAKAIACLERRAQHLEERIAKLSGINSTSYDKQEFRAIRLVISELSPKKGADDDHSNGV